MTTKDKSSSTDSPSEDTLAKNKSVGGIVHDFVSDFVFKIPKKPFEDKVAKLTSDQKQQLQEIEEKAVVNFQGQLDELESALGMLRMGYHFGWKVLYLIHSKRTIRKYEGLLNIKVRELFPETGPSSYRSYGLTIAEKYSNFWKVAGGDIKIPDRKKVE
jgi:hypothetical protein